MSVLKHSVVFINSPERTYKANSLFLVSPTELLFRIFASFVPPVSQKYRRVYVDLLGPILAVLVLTGFIQYGYSKKHFNVGVSPTNTVCLFSVLMPILSYFLCKLSRSSIMFSEIVSLVGYCYYGHLITLFVSFLCFHETSNLFFFVCLILFGGLSTLRLTLVILTTIPTPAARLLVCTIISTVNVLFVIFLHFAFMHRTYYYSGV